MADPAGPAELAMSADRPPWADPLPRARRGALGLPLVVAAAAAVAIAAYLGAVRLLGEAPVCGPSRGCELVQSSSYSTLFGVLPVAYLGLGFALLVLLLAARWWWHADRWALVGAYGLLILGTLFAGYLTFLELFVIHAICPWCVGFAVSVVAGLAVAGVAVLRTGRGADGADGR